MQFFLLTPCICQNWSYHLLIPLQVAKIGNQKKKRFKTKDVSIVERLNTIYYFIIIFYYLFLYYLLINYMFLFTIQIPIYVIMI